MTGTKNKTRAQSAIQAKAGEEREATGVVRPVAKTWAKAKDKPGSLTDAVAEMKAVSKNKVVAEMKEGALSEPKALGKAIGDFSPKARNESTSSTCENGAVWAEEEATIKEAGNHSSAKNDKPEIGAQVSAEELEPVAGASCKPRSGAEEEEEENVIGNWFWEGDGTSFNPNPKPESRIVKPQPPKDCSEVTIWPKSPAITPAVSQASEASPPSYIVLGLAEEISYSWPVAAACPSRNTCSCSQPVPEEVNGIKPFACPCKMECYVDPEEFEKLVSLLKSTTDPLVHKRAQIAMGIHNIHPFVQEFINEMDERQHKIELHVKHMCKDTTSFPLNSPGQQSELKILGQLTMDFVHHYIVASDFSELFHLPSSGKYKARNLVLKVILNMPENPTAARDTINMKALAASKLIFNHKEAKTNLVSGVAVFINIKEHIRKGSIVVVDHLSYNTLMGIFREVKGIIETM
uniref:Armadillo repeat-containing domain-containing protein n=1 Tax=Macaca nemestrina TaxID=9545 RepID=A0A2K6B2S3_MACNE